MRHITRISLVTLLVALLQFGGRPCFAQDRFLETRALAARPVWKPWLAFAAGATLFTLVPLTLELGTMRDSFGLGDRDAKLSPLAIGSAAVLAAGGISLMSFGAIRVKQIKDARKQVLLQDARFGLALPPSGGAQVHVRLKF